MMINDLLISLGLITMLFVAGCSVEDNTAIANPASVFCEQNGGTLEIRESNEGQYGVCIFNDGSECEEWAFQRGECKIGESIGYSNNPKKASCESAQGYWNEEFKECLGIDKNSCESIGGEFDECASACRHNPEAEMCTMQCVVVCDLK